MNPNTKRSIQRWIHVVFGLSLVAYIYGPPSETQQYLPFFRYFYMPVVLLTGLWMWKGHLVVRFFSKK
jgi:hypothetical protein